MSVTVEIVVAVGAGLCARRGLGLAQSLCGDVLEINRRVHRALSILGQGNDGWNSRALSALPSNHSEQAFSDAFAQPIIWPDVQSHRQAIFEVTGVQCRHLWSRLIYPGSFLGSWEATLSESRVSVALAV